MLNTEIDSFQTQLPLFLPKSVEFEDLNLPYITERKKLKPVRFGDLAGKIPPAYPIAGCGVEFKFIASIISSVLLGVSSFVAYIIDNSLSLTFIMLHNQ